MPPELVDLAQKSPGVILIVLGLYLFRVVVNDLKHDAEAARQNTDTLVDHAKRQTDLLERIERTIGGRRDD